MNADDLVYGGFFAFLGIFVLCLFGALAYAGVDAVQERRAFSGVVACEQQQMLPRRNSLSATVVCVPAIQRQDTTTVRVTR